LNSSNLHNHASLANCYHELGNKEKAAEFVEKALSDPLVHEVVDKPVQDEVRKKLSKYIKK
jgi:hypothetical protein